MLVSNCCGARFHEPDYPDNDICTACGDHASPEKTNYNLIKQRVDRENYSIGWRENIRFAKKKKAIDKDIHNHPLGAGFAHKDSKDND